MAYESPPSEGDSDPTISVAKQYLQEFGYAEDLDATDTYTEMFGAALRVFGAIRNVEIDRGTENGPKVNIAGVYDWAMKLQLGVIEVERGPLAAAARRKIWIYSAPGSGADAQQGPPFDVGRWCSDVLALNHVPLVFPKGGYLGLMGGDPGLSYDEVIAAEGERLADELDGNPDIDDPDVELWFVAYSQSADGMEDAVQRLFGDGGKYAHLRSRINGLIHFGNPSRQPGPTKIGNNPPGSGISRKVRPGWLKDLVWSITAVTPNGPDTYACTTDDTALPLFYEWFVKAETSLAFAGYSSSIIIPAIASYLHLPGFLVGPAVAAAAQVGLDFIQQQINAFGGNPALSPNPELVRKLSAKYLISPEGLLTLYRTLAALPGINTHGAYFEPHPEFGGRTGIQVACDVVASFRR
jgi:hypothetical protein